MHDSQPSCLFFTPIFMTSLNIICPMPAQLPNFDKSVFWCPTSLFMPTLSMSLIGLLSANFSTTFKILLWMLLHTHNEILNYFTGPDGEPTWEVTFQPITVPGPHNITIKSSRNITLTNILIGDVWVCSGQSNMEHQLDRVRSPLFIYPFSYKFWGTNRLKNEYFCKSSTVSYLLIAKIKIG